MRQDRLEKKWGKRGAKLYNCAISGLVMAFSAAIAQAFFRTGIDGALWWEIPLGIGLVTLMLAPIFTLIYYFADAPLFGKRRDRE